MTTRHTVRITTRDAQTISFECDETQNLIDAAAEAQITLPSTCRSGACGTCSGTCREGDYELGPHSEEALNAAARAEGGILLCRTYARSDLAVEVPADLAHITAGPVPQHDCEVTAIEDLGGQVMRLELQAQGGAVMFEPGQYMELTIPGTDVSRAYSLSNAPNWAGTLEFIIRLQPDGKFSTWLKNAAAVGDRIQARGPQGSMVLQSGSLNPRRFVAGGTGLAPMLSMLRHMVALGEMNDAHLYLGVNSEQDLFGHGQLDELRAALPHVRIDVCVWKASDQWQGCNGTPADALERDLGADLAGGMTPEIYLCGPPGLVDAVEALVAEKGIPHGAVFSEKFLPS